MQISAETTSEVMAPEMGFPTGDLTSMLESLGEAILCTDALERISFANAAAQKLLEREASSLKGELVREILPLRNLDGSALTEDFFELVRRTRLPVRFDASIQGLGRRNAVAGTVAAVYDGHEYVGLVLALRDVTELLHTREQLEFSERLAALGTLAAGVAHEVNNPLAVVVSSVGYCLDVGSTNPMVIEALTDARDAATRVSYVIDALRDFSQPHVEAVVPFDPRATFGTALHLTHGQWRKIAGVSLELGVIPLVMAVPARLTQVVVSLVINAVQSMEPLGGNRLLTLASRTDSRGWAELSVTDDGPGVSTAAARRIFDPFFTTKPPGAGTGLGLSIARTIVENHKGTLTVEPAPGGAGACFTVRLPPTTEAGPEVAPLDVWWVGPPTAESRRLCPDKQLDVSDDLGPTIGADLLLLNVSIDGLSALHAKHPDLDFRGLLVNQPPPPGLRSIKTEGLELDALIAYVRRGR